MQNTPRFENVPTIHAVLLDVDGTLLDSNAAHASAWAQALSEHGIRVAPAMVHPLVGMGGDRIIRAVSGIEPGPELADRIRGRRAEIFQSRFVPHLRPFPRVRDLLAELRRRGVRVVVASSATRDDLDPLLARAQVTDLIDARTSGDDARASKPAPDIILAALARAHVAADQAVLVGDTPWDVEAARRAGVRCIAVRTGGWPDAALDGAIAIVDDPAQLLSLLDRLPFGRGHAMAADPPGP